MFIILSKRLFRSSGPYLATHPVSGSLAEAVCFLCSRMPLDSPARVAISFKMEGMKLRQSF